MKITLVRTGGFIPITKKSEKEVDWTDDEFKLLVSTIKTDGRGAARDNTSYLIKSKAGTFPIDWGKIPAKYVDTFEELKDNLAIVK